MWALFVMFINPKFLFFKLEFSYFVFWRYKSYGKIQNFSSLSLKLCLLAKKNHRDMGCEYHYRRINFELKAPKADLRTTQGLKQNQKSEVM